MNDAVQRIKLLMELKELSKEAMTEKTGIKYSRLGNIFSGRAQLRHEEIELIGKAFPEYKLWIAYGETAPEIGQISPEIEEATANYRKQGKAGK